MNHFVNGSFYIHAQNVQFKLIGIINHDGLFQNGHYYAILEWSNRWYICEDAKNPKEVSRHSIFSVSNYIYIFEKVIQTTNLKGNPLTYQKSLKLQ